MRTADRSGTVAIMFGLLIIQLTAMIGLAIDFGRAYAVNAQLQSALDAAALAAGRVTQVEKTDTLNKASVAATAYFNQTKPRNVVSSTLQFSPNAQNTQFTVTATSWVGTPFLGVLQALGHKDSAAGAPAGCVGKGYFGTNTDTSCPVANHSDAEINSIQPLTKDRTMLKASIDKRATGGSTAGHQLREGHAQVPIEARDPLDLVLEGGMLNRSSRSSKPRQGIVYQSIGPPRRA